MKRLLILLFLSIAFYGCKKNDSSSPLVGKWFVTKFRKKAFFNNESITDTVTVFPARTSYYNFYPEGNGSVLSPGHEKEHEITYSLKNDELLIKIKDYSSGNIEPWKVVELTERNMVLMNLQLIEGLYYIPRDNYSGAIDSIKYTERNEHFLYLSKD